MQVPAPERITFRRPIQSARKALNRHRLIYLAPKFASTSRVN